MPSTLGGLSWLPLSSRDGDMDQALYDLTMEEVERGWLEGPIAFDDLPEEATVSRRFGVRQGSRTSDGSRVFKVRPIDDLTESLINPPTGAR